VQVLPLELLVLPDVRRDHPPDPLGVQQLAQAPVVDAAVVRHRLQVRHPCVEDGLDQHAGNTAQPEAADRE
jgi:hypothetical protein